MINRRHFLHRSLHATGLMTLGVTVPEFLRQTAQATTPGKSQRTLVVIQLSGGNDGLNTVIPFRDNEYYKNRSSLGIGKSQVLSIDDDIGFHPSLSGFAELLEDNRLSVVQGVGYPNPNRSHFRSMDIWHTAVTNDETISDGWLGRAVSQERISQEGKIPAIHIGREKLPLALVGKREVPSIGSLDELRINAPARARQQIVSINSQKAQDDTLQFLQRSKLEAFATSEQLEKISKSPSGSDPYPRTTLGQKLRTIGQIISSGMETPIYYVSQGGYDTHSGQQNLHANLLREMGDATRAFLVDMKTRGLQEQVMVMVFSEFGRRVKENGSRGTDHGAAAPMFVAGPRLKRQVHGKHPSLTDLENGDLRFKTDFRSVYASILKQWLECPIEPVLKREFQPIDLLS